MKVTFLILSAISLFSLNSALCQDTTSLTLLQAVDLAVKNSKQLKLSDARIEQAIAQSRQANEARLPDATVTTSYLRLTKAAVNLKGAGDGNDTAKSRFPNINQAVYGMANVSLPLFAGFKVRYGIESAKFLEQATRLDAANDRQSVMLNAVAAYINLYKANIAGRLVQDNLSQSKQRDADFVNLEKNGLLARNDLLRAQLETSALEQSLFDAQNTVDVATVNMDLLLGLPETTKLRLDSSGLFTAGEIKAIDEYEQLATQNRYDLRALELREKASAAAIKIAKGDYYPAIALTGGYVAADVPGLVAVTNAITGGIGVKYSLSSLWKTKSKVQEAQAQQRQLQINRDILSDNIHLSINKAYRDYLTSLKKIDVSNKAVEQATENYRISKNKYANNLLLLTDLLDAKVSELQARLDLSVAKADVVLAYYTLQQSAGVLKQ